jgi:hypothetical protein
MGVTTGVVFGFRGRPWQIANLAAFIQQTRLVKVTRHIISLKNRMKGDNLCAKLCRR